jgi:hypothetical protein
MKAKKDGMEEEQSEKKNSKGRSRAEASGKARCDCPASEQKCIADEKTRRVMKF